MDTANLIFLLFIVGYFIWLYLAVRKELVAPDTQVSTETPKSDNLPIQESIPSHVQESIPSHVENTEITILVPTQARKALVAIQEVKDREGDKEVIIYCQITKQSKEYLEYKGYTVKYEALGEMDDCWSTVITWK